MSNDHNMKFLNGAWYNVGTNFGKDDKKTSRGHTQMRAWVEIEMQVQLERRVEHQVQEHIQQQLLEVIDREEAWYRESGNKRCMT